MQDRIKNIIKQKWPQVTPEDIAVMNVEIDNLLKTNVKPHTVAIMEPHAWHGENYPSVMKNFLDLGYNMHLLVNAEHLKVNSLVNCPFPSDRFKIFPFKHFPNTLSFFEFLLNYEYLFLMTTLTHEGFHHALSLENNYLQKYDKNNLYCISHELSSLDNEADTFDRRMLNSGRVFVLRGGIEYNGQEIPFVSPVYFGECDNTKGTAPKNKKTKFISVGGVWKKGLRNFDNLFKAIQKLHENNIRGFEVVFVGVDKILLESYLTPEMRAYITLIGRVPFKDLYDSVRTADFILFNTDYTTADYEKYLHRGITGNYSLSIGFGKPGLIYEELGEEYLLDAARAVNYTDDLYEAMKTAIEMPPGKYELMCNNLVEFKRQLEQKSLENMKEGFGGILEKCH
jgi:hypothetical protein